MKISIFKLLSFPLFLFVLQSVVSQNIAQDPHLQSAFQAQGALKVTEAADYFKRVVDNTTASDKDRCTALRELAILHWKHYKDYDQAKEYLVLADSIGDYRSETWLNVLRVESESNQFPAALEAGKKAMAIAQSQADKNYSKYKYSKVVLDQALSQLYTDEPMNTKLLQEAAILLEEVLHINPTHVNASNILLGISLLQKDAGTALKSWLAYYRCTKADNAYAYLKPVATQIEGLLTKWEGQPLSRAEQIELMEALGASRFYNYTRIIAKQMALNSHDLLHYATYIEAIEAITNEYYRKASLGTADSDTYISRLGEKNEALYKQLVEQDSEPYERRHFRSMIRAKFGGFMLISRTSASNQTGLVFGHIVNERIRSIEQYGHQADFTFTELDMMISNGYPSWFWEDRGAGGYALRGGFLRIKTMFKFLAIDAWQRVTDPVKRAKIESEIETNLIASNLDTDIKVIRSAVSKKMNLDALDSLYNRLVKEGLQGLELQLKFIESYELYRDNATMFAHEGRHSIDRVVLGQESYRALGAKIIEYRGRLSQIAFSESPKLEVANMLVGVSSTPTGESNTMILDVIEAWIMEHTDQIADYNEKQLPLANFYKLTDSQLTNCIRKVDPLYLEYQKEKE